MGCKFTLRGARGVSVFLQGSYKNDTNVYGDSDVDIVIYTDAVYYSDTSNLPVRRKNRVSMEISYLHNIRFRTLRVRSSHG